jgi:RluA family pseudouridine synthase
MKIDVLYEDEQILVVNKPAGVSVLPEGWERSPSFLLNILAQDYGKLWTVHRLDKTTSGVLTFARNATAHRSLNTQFEQHVITKIYHAILVGKSNWIEIKASHPLRSNAGHSHRTVVDPANGKKSETRFRIISTADDHSLVEVVPQSGRTHQIRAHASALGHPILGDRLYGSPITDMIKRPALHAYRIIFNHPGTGQPVEFSAPYPEDLVEAIRRLHFKFQNSSRSNSI